MWKLARFRIFTVVASDTDCRSNLDEACNTEFHVDES